MADRHIASGYIFSQAEIPTQAGPYNFISLFNPVSSTKVAILSGVFVSYSLTIGTSSTVPMRGWRISTASGGTLRPASDIAKVQSVYPDALCEVRTDNPTATLGAALFNSPPTTQKDTNFVHEVSLPSGLLPFTMRPGEGFLLRTESGLGLSSFWNLTVVWAEQGRR